MINQVLGTRYLRERVPKTSPPHSRAYRSILNLQYQGQVMASGLAEKGLPV